MLLLARLKGSYPSYQRLRLEDEHHVPHLLNLYLIGSVVMGLAQIVDCIAIIRTKNRISAYAIAFSLVEYVWAGISFFIWRQAEEPFPHWLPVSFIAYVASFMVAGVVLAASGQQVEKVIPRHLIIAGGVFGAYFAVASLLQL
jgi:hypothetical protein